MRFAETRNTLRWSLDASDELELTPCFTVPTVTAAAPAGTIVPEAAAATSPFRAPFLVPSLPPLPLPTEPTNAGGLKSVVVAPRMGAPRVAVEATGVVVVVDPDDWLAEGTRLSGEVVHFNSMTPFRVGGGGLGGRRHYSGGVWLLLLCLHNNKQTIFIPFTTP